MKKSLFLFFLLLSTFVNCYSQFSKTHYIPPLSGSSKVYPEEQYLYISTPSVTPVNFKIIEIGSKTITGTVSKSTPYTYYIGTGYNTHFLVNTNLTSAVLKNKGYIVEAEDLVYVSARLTAGNGVESAVHAGELVSKGLASLGTRFRIGAFTNTLVSSYEEIQTTFISILATENNTTINFSDIKPNVTIINNASAGNTPKSIVLNSGESYVLAVQGPNNANKDGLIGALVTADKPIAVNCGSFTGTNGEMQNLDLGFDQIVSAERTGTEYIFVKSTGMDNVERVLLVADLDNTKIYLNGATSPNYTINAGEYIALNGASYTANGNLYVKTTEKVFAYQSVGDDGLDPKTGMPYQANQELFFVPPLSCQTPKIIDNIPAIDYVGSKQFTGRVTIITTTGASLNFTADGIDYSLANLPATVVGPTNVIGNPNYKTYTITDLTGNVSVYSTGELYLAAFGSSAAATFGGFYSGFTFKPEVSFGKLDATKSGCIPNSKLSVNSLSPFDTFQWYFNDVMIPNETTSSYTPLNPGYYYVSATISSCGTPIISDKIPVSDCPIDTDNDGVNNAIDLDNDNDGITNCTESYGNLNLNLTNTASGIIAVGNYSNPYTGSITFSGSGTHATTPITGAADGNFVTETAQGKDNSVSYILFNFAKPISLSVEYATFAQTTDLLSASTEIRINCPPNKTLTLTNPNNQILVDTNYDGIFESGVTQYSSFEIRFRLNGDTPLVAGKGTFAIKGDLITSLTITNSNLLDDVTSRVALKLTATCVPKDTDNDGIIDQLDLDSDNDTIPDLIEAQGKNPAMISNIDKNNDGIYDVFGSGISPADTDTDLVPNYLDLDSDNDGIYDLTESGSNAFDINNNGIINGNIFGANGLANSVETTADSGILNYTLTDTDSDGNYNAIELDSDNDSCFDVSEAGYSDSNLDGLLGNSALPTVNANGLVTTGGGYGVPNANYIIAAPITITTQPQNIISCETNTAVFSVVSNEATSYQWQVSTDNGVSWNNITNNTSYSGSTTSSLTISAVLPAMKNNNYRVFLNRNGNTCGLYSTAAVLNTLVTPVVTSPISLIQCDNDSDGISTFNLTQKNNTISANYTSETFSYYTSLAGATSKDITDLIANPFAYTSGNNNIYTRVENANGCFSVVKMNLLISVTQIPSNFTIQNQNKCDDYLDSVNNDKDGITSFDFSSITTNLSSILPNTISIKYYKSEADMLAETDANGNSLAIADPTNYRNNGYPNKQTIWVRVDSNIDNSCFGFKTFDIIVNPLPNIDVEDSVIVCMPTVQATITAGITSNTSTSNYTYQWYKNGLILTGKIKPTLVVSSPGVYSVLVTNASQCARTRIITVTGSEKPTLESVDITDLSENNSILVTVNGAGNYDYALDVSTGPYQDSNLFTDVPMGIHEIYVHDKNGCGILGPIAAPVLGIPHYFTPNGDGFNDYWNVKGTSSIFNGKTMITVFDRFGKLLIQFTATNMGWDGTYNNHEMPSDDYWYSIQFEDGRSAKGHFALKR